MRQVSFGLLDMAYFTQKEEFNEDIIAPGTREAVETAADGIADGSVQVFAGPLHCIDADGHELNLARGEAYIENETSSAPAFAFIVDGITVLP